MLLDHDLTLKCDKLLKIFLDALSKNTSKNLKDDIIGEYRSGKQPTMNEKKYKSRIKLLKKIYYGTGYRHSYSFVSSYIISSKKDIDLVIVAENINIIYRKLIESYKEDTLKLNEDETIKYDSFLESVFKLNDHISLESIRLSDLLVTENNLSKNTKDAEQKIENKARSINRELVKIQDMIFDNFTKTSQSFGKEINKANQEINEELKKARSEYVAILGIFASIVFAFVAGLTFSTSVLSNIHQASIYRLSFIVCLIGLFITNILHYLYAFIREIHFSKTNQDFEKQKECAISLESLKNGFCNSYIFRFNLFITCIMCAIFIYWRFIDTNTKNYIDQNTSKIHQRAEGNSTAQKGKDSIIEPNISKNNSSTQ